MKTDAALIVIFTHFLAAAAGMGLYALLLSMVEPDHRIYRRPPIRWLKNRKP